MHTLVGVAYSPWTLRARMGLDLQGIPYAFEPYLPMVGEPWLRVRLRDLRTPVSVPILFRQNGAPLRDSFEIACWAAEARAPGRAPLITAENQAEVAHWNQVASRLLETGRIRTTERVLQDPEALQDSVPPPLNGLGWLTERIGRMGARHLMSRYADPGRTSSWCWEQMVASLDTIRAALGGGETLLDAPSYADLTCATALCFVRPHHSVPLGPVARRCWTEPELAADYADLLDWSDRVFARWEAVKPG